MSIKKANGGGLGGAGDPGGALGSFYSHTIDQSLRFNDDDSAYLSRTPSSAGNRKTWTWSAWVKRSSIDSTNAYILFDASSSDTAAAIIEFGKSTEGDNSLNIVSYQGSHNIRLRTSMRFRDVSSWYHIVVAMDTSQATASDRVNIYVNGTLQTDFQIETYPTQNHEPYFNSTNQHHIGKWHDNRRFFDGYMAEVNFIDGTALDATSFGETKDGVWVPKEYSGSYGTNGFHLTFADSNYIGRDKSGSKTLVTSPSFSTFGGGDTNFTSAEYAEAFDNILSTGCDRSGSGGIIDITPSSSVTPVSHTMINVASSGYTAASRPNSVLLQGSNDGGSNWTTIDDLTNGSGANTITTSSFSNTTSYAKLRLNISENHGGSNTRFSQYIVIASDDNGDGENIFFNTNLAATDVVPDSPTNNFATYNPLLELQSPTFFEGNLKFDSGGWSSSYWGSKSTFAIPKDKKIYIELEETGIGGAYYAVGIGTASSTPTSSNIGGTGSITLYHTEFKINGTSTSHSQGSSDAGDIIGIAVDGSTGEVWFSRNGTWFTTGGSGADPSTGTDPIGTVTNPNDEDLFLVVSGNASANNLFVNFGQDSTNVASAESDANGIGTFEYAVPTDHVCLCSSSLSEPAIGPGADTQADELFNTLLYTGDDTSSRALTGLGFSPDLVWLKTRDTTGSNFLYDTVRGATKGIHSNLTQVETTYSDGLLSFDSDGFTIGDRGNHNGTDELMVTWNWKAGGSSNTFNINGTGYSSASDASLSGGDITPSGASINTAAGFGIIAYTGIGGSNAGGYTIKHGLSSPPELIFIKDRDSNSNNNQFQAASSVVGDDYAYLSTTAVFTGAALFKPNASDDTLLNVGIAGTAGARNTTNESGDDFIMYCFHSIEGFCKVGTYTGNATGYDDGTFVYTGFRPALVVVKGTGTTSHWVVTDNKRASAFNGNTTRQYWSNNVAETAYNSNRNVELFSNGFMVHGASASDLSNKINESASYVYLAYAEVPLKFANAR